MCVTSKMRDKEDTREMKFMDHIDTLHFYVAGYFSESCFTLEKGRTAWHRLQRRQGLECQLLLPGPQFFHLYNGPRMTHEVRSLKKALITAVTDIHKSLLRWVEI